MKYILSIFCVLLFVCCQKENTTNVTLVSSGYLKNYSVPKDISQPFYSYAYKNLPKDNAECLYLLSADEKLLIYNYHTGQLLKRHDFEKQGPNGIPDMAGYFIDNKEVFWALDRKIPLFHKMDSSFQIVKTIKYTQTDNKQPLISAIVYQKKDIINVGSKFYLPMFHTTYLKYIAPTLVIDTLMQTIYYTDFDFPETNSEGHDLYSKEYGKCINNKNEVIYSFHYDHDLYITNIAQDSVVKKKAKSRYVTELEDTNTDYTKSNIALTRAKDQYYGGIFYDPYRDLYFRLAFPQAEVEETNFINTLVFGRGDFAIMVLDKELNVIGETFFKGYEYASNNLLITPEGLFLSRSHCNNPEYDDDILTYERLDLQYD